MSSVLADIVVVVHLAFIGFITIGGFLAWRWPRAIWAHLAAAAYGIGIVIIGWDCPLTPLEKRLRERAGEGGYSGGFVDRYIEGVIYPERYAALLQALVGALIVVGWVGFALLHRRAVVRRDPYGAPR
jgi:hypothetical protein